MRSKETTLADYTDRVRLHIVPELGHLKVRALERGRVHELLAAKVRGGLHKKTARRILAILHSMLEHAKHDGVIAANPLSGLAKFAGLTQTKDEAQEEIRAFTRDELERFLAAAATKRPEFWLVAFFGSRTGARLGEVLGVRWSDFDWQAKTVRLERAITPKGKLTTLKTKAARTVELGQVLLETLRQHRAMLEADALSRGIGWTRPANYGPLGKGETREGCGTLSRMKRTWPWLAVLGALALGCSRANPPEAKLMTVAAEDTDTTRLAHAVLPAVAAHPGLAGIHALPDPRGAFAARALLADAAERTIDAQYYIWHGDETGTLLFEALWRAAGRGVRVRLLVDDNNTAGLDDTLAALDAHPKIEVRLYNALTRRRVRALNYVTDFRRLNHRMHNKSFTVDNQATIVGGRNVGNEYFGAGDAVVFTDLDVLAVGPVVREVSGAFDRFWNSASATPAGHLLRRAPAEAGQGLEAHFAAVRQSVTASQYVDALHRTELVTELLESRLTLEWAEARLVCDDPAKTLDRKHQADLLLLPRMLELVGRPAKELDLVSPYFVPMSDGTAAFQELARSGVRVRVLTNSLSATDVTAVHAGYAKRRVPLLQSGVRLFELERTGGAERSGTGGSSSASLHAKTFAVDRERLFVGSFNFDPRSAELNTEMGLVIHSPALAGRLAESFDTHVPSRAYEVRLSADGKLSWIERTPEGEKRYDTEPGVGFFRRATVGLLSILPIEREL